MSDLINRQATIDYFFKPYSNEESYSNVDIKRILKSLPSAESERKKGQWLSHTTCSECGWQMIDDVLDSPNMVGFKFCPNCGADMRSGQDEDR